jgi:hypothetical protein
MLTRVDGLSTPSGGFLPGVHDEVAARDDMGNSREPDN